MSVPVAAGGSVVADAVRLLDAAGIGIADLSVRRPTLDDVFLTLTGLAAEATKPEQADDGEAPLSAHPVRGQP